MKTGLIDVGGGMRGIYGAGVLDTCINLGVRFDYCIGISAGSANISSFLGGQAGRNYRFFHDYSFRKEYMSMSSLRKTGSFLGLKYIYGTLSNSDGEDPLDYKKLQENKAEFKIIATNAENGEKKIFDKKEIPEDDYRIFMASCCVPVASRPVEINGIHYFDGALSDPVPLNQAFNAGCDKVVLVLTKPVNYIRKQGKDKWLAMAIRHKYPLAAENLLKRAERYNKGVELAKKYEEQGKVLILAPESTCGLDTLKRDSDAFDLMYHMGIKDGEILKEWI